MSSRKARGAATQTLVAQWFRTHGFPWAESTGAGRPGRDVTNMIGLACEVKARRDWNPVAWLKQAKSYAGHDLPFCVARPDGYGPTNINNWPVVIGLNDFTTLIRAAGYGDPLEPERTDDD